MWNDEEEVNDDGEDTFEDEDAENVLQRHRELRLHRC